MQPLPARFITAARVSTAAALLVGFVLSAAAVPARGQVHDNAGIFSKEAVRHADDAIAQMKAKHRHTLLLETYPKVPDNLQAEYESKGKEKFFKEWTLERGKAEQVSGVITLIVMNPGHLQVEIGNQTQKRIFTQQDREDMQGPLTEALHDKRYDEALTRTVDFVAKRMDANDPQNAGATGAAPAAPADPSSPATPPPLPPNRQTNYSVSNGPLGQSGGAGSHIGMFICLFVGVILVIVLLRAVFRGRGGPGGYGGGPGFPMQGPGQGGYPPPPGGYGPGYGPGPGYGQPARGGGFGSGFLGGLLGGAVGGYATDKLMHHGEGGQGGGGAAAPGGGNYTAPPADPGGGFTPDTDYSGGGSDFGSPPASGGGSDFGGGDSGSSSGGSDFGSSDSGGGSDFGGGDSGSSSGGSDF